MTGPNKPLLPRLDDEPGPMPQLSAAEADAIARGAVSRWAARPPGLEPADDGVGPSQPLTPQAAERLARSALRVHTRKQLLSTSQLKVAALWLSGALGLAMAAYGLWPAEPGSKTSVADVQLQAAKLAPAAPEREKATELPAVEPRPRAAESGLPLEAAEPAQGATLGAQPENKAKLEPPPASEEPEELLARANALRSKRRWGAAESTYRQVLSTQASDQQRYVALVAAAAIALQHLDKPGRALGLYQSALALTPHGNLSEETLFGIAECYRALKNPAAELRTLQRLSAEHPAGLLSETVKQRLASLAEN